MGIALNRGRGAFAIRSASAYTDSLRLRTVSEARPTSGRRALTHSTRRSLTRALMCAAIAMGAAGSVVTPASSEALLVIEAESGKVVHAENAGQPWYPASVTKLMTAYVVLRAVKEGRLTLETGVKVSQAAAA